MHYMMNRTDMELLGYGCKNLVNFNTRRNIVLIDTILGTRALVKSSFQAFAHHLKYIVRKIRGIHNRLQRLFHMRL